MAIQKRLYTVDDVWEMQCQPGNGDKHFELIDGELIEMSPANLLHAWFASKISSYINIHAEERGIGSAFVEAGFYPHNDRHTLLAPDVAYVRKERLPQPIPQTFVGFMPDLAVEIVSPSNTTGELLDKAAIYLRNGTRLVWIVRPDDQSVDVCRLSEHEHIEVTAVGADGKLTGEDVLPGFELELRKLFPSAEN